MTRELTAELHSEGPKAGQSLSCALSQQKKCCNGRGFQIVPHGAYARAVLCECARACPMCMGQLQMLENGFARPCTSRNVQRTIAVYNEANIPWRYEGARLTNFKNHGGNGKDVMRRISTFTHEVQLDSGRGFILSGPVGVGKTYILCAVAYELILRGFSVRFVDFFQLLAELKAGYSADRADHTMLAPLIAVDVLIIDELGKGRNTEWEHTILDQLVMGRYNQRKIIIASTNCNFQAATSNRDQAYANVDLERELGPKQRFNPDVFEPLEARVGDRIYSRLIESCATLELNGPDYRKILGRQTSGPQAQL